MLKQPRGAAARTRFKMWHRLVGSALEHAAEVSEETLDFQKLFLVQEVADDDDSTSLGGALAVMQRRWSEGFKASDVADLVNLVAADAILPDNTLREMKRDSIILRDFLFHAPTSSSFVATPRAVGNLLKSHVEEPVRHGEETLVLRKRQARDGVLTYSVSVSRK